MKELKKMRKSNIAKQLLVNADGFGFTAGVNRGIIEAIENGIVLSTSALANMGYIDEVSDLTKQFPDISIGVHLNLSVGKPVSPVENVSSLVNQQGEFWGQAFVPKLLSGKLKMAEMVTELDRQIERIVTLGVHPTHIDGHQNLHLYPPFLLAALKVAEKWDIHTMRTHNRYLFMQGKVRQSKIINYYLMHPKRFVTHSMACVLMWYVRRRRMKTADRLITPGYMDGSHKSALETWLSIIKNLPQGTNEIYCHPGYPDDELAKYAYYVKERETEIQVLTDPQVKKAISENEVELISFYDLGKGLKET